MAFGNLAERVLPQPTSFSKKKNYEVHGTLGEGTFGKVLRATWRPDPTQGVSGGRPSGSGLLSHPASSVPDSVGQGDGFSIAPGSEAAKNGIDVALKVIPKKAVKGNEDVVWGEMEVLRGLDHPNIVSL